MLTPAFIGSYKTLSTEASYTTFYGNINYNQSKKAFINSSIYSDYIINEVIRYVKKRRIEIGKENL